MHKLTKHSKLSDTDRKRKSVLFSRTPHSIKLSVRIPSPRTLICVTMCDRSHCYKPMPENIFKVLTAVMLKIKFMPCVLVRIYDVSKVVWSSETSINI
jgi:hypothetical protein